MKRIFCTAMLVALVAPALMAQTVKKTKEFMDALSKSKAFVKVLYIYLL